MAKPETAEAATTQGDQPVPKPWAGSGPGGFSWKAILLAALGIYAILLIILNSKTVSVDFVFFSHETRVIFLVLLSIALGALIMWFVPRRRQRTKAKRSASDGNEGKPWAGSGPGGVSWKAIVLAALGIYAILLIIMNSQTVSVDFVFVSHRTRLIFLVLLCVALGALIMWFVPRRRQRNKAKRSTRSSDAEIGTTG